MKKSQNNLKFAVLATDIVCFKIENFNLKVLLGKVSGNPFFPNHLALIGGLVHPDEIAEKASERLLFSKAGISGVYKEQFHTFDRLERDPRGRVVAVAHLAIAQNAKEEHEIGSIETSWVSVNQLPILAYDHNEMIRGALKHLHSRFAYTNIVQYFLPNEFSLSDLQKVYEVVLNKKLDKRNFRKKILSVGILKKTSKTRKEGIMRPAMLYRFVSNNIFEVNIL